MNAFPNLCAELVELPLGFWPRRALCFRRPGPGRGERLGHLALDGFQLLSNLVEFSQVSTRHRASSLLNLRRSSTHCKLNLLILPKTKLEAPNELKAYKHQASQLLGSPGGRVFCWCHKTFDPPETSA